MKSGSIFQSNRVLYPARHSTELDLTSDDMELNEYRNKIERSIAEFNKEYANATSQRRIRRNEDRARYDYLINKIAREEKIIEELEEENRLLKSEIERCELKIKNYPMIKKRYDKLSSSVVKAHEINSKRIQLF